MSENLETIKWSELKEMSFDEVANLRCLEIVDDDGKPKERWGVFLMVPINQFIQIQTDSKGSMSNTCYIKPKEEEPFRPLYVSKKDKLKGG